LFIGPDRQVEVFIDFGGALIVGCTLPTPSRLFSFPGFGFALPPKSQPRFGHFGFAHAGFRGGFHGAVPDSIVLGEPGGEDQIAMVNTAKVKDKKPGSA
jgi:hypothetical protein